jgi:hypothetical protein
MDICWRHEIMKQTHGIIFWLVVIFAVFPTLDGMLTGVPPAIAPHQHYWMGNLTATLIMAAIILGMACVFEGKHNIH